MNQDRRLGAAVGVALSVLVLVTLGLLPLGASAQTLFKDPVHQKEFENGRDTMINVIAGKLSEGETIRGPSGPMMELLKSSGDLTCQAWIISFNLRLRNLVLADADPELIAKAYDLRAKVEKACQTILEETPPVTPPRGPGETTPGTPPPAGDPFVPRPGWTLVDEICFRRCVEERNRYHSAIADVKLTEPKLHEAEETLAHARAQAADLERQIAEAEKSRAEAEAILRRPRRGTLSPADEKDLVAAGQRKSNADHTLRLSLPKREEYRRRVETAEALVRSRRRDKAEAEDALEKARLAYEDCMRRCQEQAKGAQAPATPKCALVPAKPMTVGPQNEVGAGTGKMVQDAARNVVGGLFGGGGGGGFGIGGLGGGSRMGGAPSALSSSGPKGPSLVADPVPAKQAFAHPDGLSTIKLGGRMTEEGLKISAEIESAPGKGTFHSLQIEDDACRVLKPKAYYLWKLWEEWTLTVTWWRERYVDGQRVSREEGGWQQSGRRDIAQGVVEVETEANPLWKRFGYDRATEGVQGLGADFAVTTDQLAGGAMKLVIHVSNPSVDPVVTMPFDLRIAPQPDGSIAFVRFE
ncbi:MAG: hypothetical protein HZC25_13320 [Rhodospirillales bacterium]|nr:hypothetical protein [Rhodospirillales bacterium]